MIVIRFTHLVKPGSSRAAVRYTACISGHSFLQAGASSARTSAVELVRRSRCMVPLQTASPRSGR